jgi:predicted PurR-regulated permease PerM
MDQISTESSGRQSATKIVLILAGFVVIVFGMREAAEIITPIIIAFILAILFFPLHRWMIDRHVPTWLALVIVMLVILLVLSVMVSVTVISITQFINRIPDYSDSLQGLINGALALIEMLPIDLGTSFNFEMFDVTQILNVSGGLLSGFLDALSNWFIVFLLVAFMLADFAFLPDKFEAMFKGDQQIMALSDLMSSIRRYLSITTSVGLIVGIANTILLVIIGVDFALLWGIVSFLMNFIPNVGIIISIIPPVILTLLEFNWQTAIVCGAGLVLINFFTENVIKPRVLEEDLDISPLFVLISLVLWTFVLGPIGTILAVPLTLIATKLLLEASDETRWLAILTTANPREKKQKKSSNKKKK